MLKRIKYSFTLCDKDLKGDIPTFTYTDLDDALELMHVWIDSKNFEESVFVCFGTMVNNRENKIRNEQDSILVSHNHQDIINMFTDYFCSADAFNDNLNDADELDFSIFEFENYQEAFKYCTDLKESF